MALNKALLKAEMENIILAMYGNGSGQVASVADIFTYGEVDLSEFTDIAEATYPEKANETGILYPIKGRIKAYFDYVSGGNKRKTVLMQYNWTWSVSYDASGVPTITKQGGTFEWDEEHKGTQDILEHATICGWSRA